MFISESHANPVCMQYTLGGAACEQQRDNTTNKILLTTVDIDCIEYWNLYSNYTEHDNSKQLELDEAYHLKYKVVCKWNQELKEQYTLSFDIEGIDSLRNKITNAKSVGITQNIIDELYTNVKLIFLKPAKTTGMTKIVKHTKFSRKPRSHAKHKWFTKECEILRKDYMF